MLKGREGVAPPGSPPPPPRSPCQATLCGEVTCVGKGCVTVPLILLLLCCCCWCGWRRRWHRRYPRAMAAANAMQINVPTTHYYYGGNQVGCVPGYVIQQPGCGVQQPGYVVQQPGCIVQQPGFVVQGAGAPVVVSQPVVVAGAQSAIAMAQVQQLTAAEEEAKVPMGLPV